MVSILGLMAILAGVSALTTEMQQVLDEHNVYRCMHGLPPFTWDYEIARRAQTWSDSDHKSPSSRGTRNECGENLAWHSPTGYGDKAVEAWYNGIPDTNTLETDISTLPLKGMGKTNVMWRSSAKLGCGKGRETRNGMPGDFWVCQYCEAGNYVGQFTQMTAPCETEAQCRSQSPDAAICVKGGGGSGSGPGNLGSVGNGGVAGGGCSPGFLSLCIHGMDYGLLLNHASVRELVVRSIRKGAAYSQTTFENSGVTVNFESGSTIARLTVKPLAGSTCEDLAGELTRNGPHIASRVGQQIHQQTSINSVMTSVLNVQILEATTTATTTTAATWTETSSTTTTATVTTTTSGTTSATVTSTTSGTSTATVTTTATGTATATVTSTTSGTTTATVTATVSSTVTSSTTLTSTTTSTLTTTTSTSVTTSTTITQTTPVLVMPKHHTYMSLVIHGMDYDLLVAQPKVQELVSRSVKGGATFGQTFDESAVSVQYKEFSSGPAPETMALLRIKAPPGTTAEQLTEQLKFNGLAIASRVGQLIHQKTSINAVMTNVLNVQLRKTSLDRGEAFAVTANTILKMATVSDIESSIESAAPIVAVATYVGCWLVGLVAFVAVVSYAVSKRKPPTTVDEDAVLVECAEE